MRWPWHQEWVISKLIFGWWLRKESISQFALWESSLDKRSTGDPTWTWNQKQFPWLETGSTRHAAATLTSCVHAWDAMGKRLGLHLINLSRLFPQSGRGCILPTDWSLMVSSPLVSVLKWKGLQQNKAQLRKRKSSAVRTGTTAKGVSPTPAVPAVFLSRLLLWGVSLGLLGLQAALIRDVFAAVRRLVAAALRC